jgi:hypothetical protein
MTPTIDLDYVQVPLVEQLRGHSYEKPVAKMTTYLDARTMFRVRASLLHQRRE